MNSNATFTWTPGSGGNSGSNPVVSTLNVSAQGPGVTTATQILTMTIQ
jgi:hypothetical protein